MNQAPRLRLAATPTPLVPCERLGAQLGINLWVKRDDVTGGAEAGNKVRKLEFLLAEAVAQGADTVITCGGLQSNHARATAVCAAALGLRSVLFLRTADPLADVAALPLEGNVLIDRLVGAEIRLISVSAYAERTEVMDRAADELRSRGHTPYIIPEGGSNGRGALGYVEAMREVRDQLDGGLANGERFDMIVHACGSGGTGAGVMLGAARYDVASEVRPMAVCDDAPTFDAAIARIAAEAQAIDPSLDRRAKLVVDARAKGPAYAVSSASQRRVIVRVAREAGIVLDPVYTGKAFAGLVDLAESGAIDGARVLFVHTGGLPGLLAQGREFASEVAGPASGSP